MTYDIDYCPLSIWQLLIVVAIIILHVLDINVEQPNAHDSMDSGFLIGSRCFDLCRISNMTSCFSTIQTPLSAFCCFVFAINC